MRIRITRIHPFDAWFSERDDLLGVEGQAFGLMMSGFGWYQFDFRPNHLRTPIHLMFADFEKL